MDITRRRELASRLLDGYVHGPAAGTEATALALAKVAAADAIVLVEGISDQIAVETLAARGGRDLRAERVVVLPIGGAHAFTRYLRQFGPAGADLRLRGLCDLGEEKIVRRGLASAGIGSPASRADMERLGFYVCVEDLEDELIRAIGAIRIEALIDSQGDLGSFRSLQRQPQDPVRAPARRSGGSGPAAASPRRGAHLGITLSARYSALLVELRPQRSLTFETWRGQPVHNGARAETRLRLREEHHLARADLPLVVVEVNTGSPDRSKRRRQCLLAVPLAGGHHGLVVPADPALGGKTAGSGRHNLRGSADTGNHLSLVVRMRVVESDQASFHVHLRQQRATTIDDRFIAFSPPPSGMVRLCQLGHGACHQLDRSEERRVGKECRSR